MRRSLTVSSSALIRSSKSLLIVAMSSKALIRCSRSELGDGLLEADFGGLLVGAGLMLVVVVEVVDVVAGMVVGSGGNWDCRSARYLFNAGGAAVVF